MTAPSGVGAAGDEELRAPVRPDAQDGEAATCNGAGWCVKRDAAPLGEPWCNGAGRCVKGYAAPSSSAARDGDSEGLEDAISTAVHNELARLNGLCRCGEAGRLDCQDITDALLAGPLRQLVTERAEAVAAVERVRALHKPVMNWTAPECEACSTFDDDCSHIAPSPCPTLRALSPSDDREQQ